MGNKTLIQVKTALTDRFGYGTSNPTFEKEFTKDRSPGARIRPQTRLLFNESLRKQAKNNCLTARGLLADGGVQAEASAHALLPGALFFVTLFDLGDGGGQGFAAELAHLQI